MNFGDTLKPHPKHMKAVSVLSLRKVIFSKSYGRETRSRAGAGPGEARSMTGAGAEGRGGEARSRAGTGKTRRRAGAGHREPEGQLNRLREFPIA